MWFGILEVDVSFERFMKILKSYVKNHNRPEGCIVESYMTKEALEFCSKYLVNIESIRIPKGKFEYDSRGEEHLQRFCVIWIIHHGYKLINISY